MRKKDKDVLAVVDTNLFVSGLINRSGSPARLVEALRQGAFTLAVSEQLHTEYKRVFPRPKFTHKFGVTEQEIAEFLFLIGTNSRRVTPVRRLPLKVRDNKDAKVLAAALGGKAGYLVTGDDDLLSLRDDPGLGELKIVMVTEFLEILASLRARNQPQLPPTPA